MGEPLRPVTVDPGAGTTIQGPAGGPLTFKVRGEQTGGLLTAFENIVAPGDGPPLHTHANEDESWYVLEGRLRFELGGELRDAPQGAFVFVPDLPKTRNAKIMRRIIRASYLNQDPGDLSALENPQSVQAVRNAI
jgi:uncharacterized RmlC-like cupin family protein